MTKEQELTEATKRHLEDCMRAFVSLVAALNEVQHPDPHWAAQLRHANIQIARAREFANSGKVPPEVEL